MQNAQCKMNFFCYDRVYFEKIPINRIKTMNKKELENRLIEFSVRVTQWMENAAKNPTIRHLKEQIIRSSNATALNYGEAQSAESRKDFIHKVGIVLKELRETQINLRMVKLLLAHDNDGSVDELIKEFNHLIKDYKIKVWDGNYLPFTKD